MVDDRPAVAVSSVASRLVREALEEALEPGYIEEFREDYARLDDHYWDEVCAEARRLVERLDVSDLAFEASYEFLAAKGAEK